MSTPAVTTTFGSPDPNASPTNIIQLVALLNSLVSSAIQGSYIPYIIDSITPGADQQDFAWIQTDSVGRPLGVKIYYNGNWRRIYNGMAGEVRMYSGDPSVDFDDNGLGLVGETFDGWHLCNGMDGTPDLSDKFIVGGHMNNADGHVGYSSGWQTFIDGTTDQKTGGAAKQTIKPENLPPFDAVLGSSKVTIHGFEAKEASSSHTNVAVLADVHYSDLLPHDAVIGNYGSGPNDSPPVPQVDLPILPSFIAMGYIIFVGYA